jgi:phosphopantothenoylcysteine synthetase/decarboxylase
MPGALAFAVCGAPLAAKAPEVATALVARGWELAVDMTEAGAEWVGVDQLAAAAEAEVRIRRRSPAEVRHPTRPRGVLAFPLTFNTANKVAAGINDNRVTGTLCDALGTGTPVVAALMVSNRLWGHPAWSTTLRCLAEAGVRFVDLSTGEISRPAPVMSGTGAQVVADFAPEWIVDAVESVSAEPRSDC